MLIYDQFSLRCVIKPAGWKGALIAFPCLSQQITFYLFLFFSFLYFISFSFTLSPPGQYFRQLERKRSKVVLFRVRERSDAGRGARRFQTCKLSITEGKCLFYWLDEENKNYYNLLIFIIPCPQAPNNSIWMQSRHALIYDILVQYTNDILLMYDDIWVNRDVGARSMWGNETTFSFYPLFNHST